MKYLFTILFIGVSALLSAQMSPGEAKAEIEAYENEKEERVQNYLLKHPSIEKKIGSKLLWDVIDNKPIYIEDLNLRAALSTRTNFIKTDGDLDLNLTGNGMSIGIWEVGGLPQDDHTEFEDSEGESRVVLIDNIGTSFHATHVAGTLAARGDLPNAEGMAVAAILKAYDAPRDVIEASTEARDNNLLVSNHSYGVPIANISGNEWLAGAYNDTARVWDNITNAYPYYLPVVSAGNDGRSQYEGGIAPGYDKLTTNKNSKNLLIVANAINIFVDNETGELENAFINIGSSQGPTDDGRIKPDVTGLGSNIISTAPNGQYGQATGTSMSAPNVSGSALLLQELYERLNNEYMLSSTLKGLISVTADDVGDTGPDPFFGWGIMNSKRAAEVIINNEDGDILKEIPLVEGNTERIRVSNTTGKMMKVGIAWNDPLGNEATNGVFNDPTPRLVNDLDLRIESLDSGDEYLPWRLDLENVTESANNGDNVVDNIEVIEIEEQGVFDITISHKDDLRGGEQVFSLIVLNGIEEPLSTSAFNSESITLWPNPVKNSLNISSSEISFSEDVQVSIYDMTGRRILSFEDLEISNNLKLDMSSLSKGIYVLNINDGGQSIQKRIIKE